MQPAACTLGSKYDPRPHWRAEKCFFDAHVPEKNRFELIFPPEGGKTLPRAFCRYKTIDPSCIGMRFFDSLQHPPGRSLGLGGV